MGLTRWKSFEIVFKNLIKHIVVETNRYANRDQNKPDFLISEEEMMNFIGLLLLSGYNSRKNQREYWSTDPDLCCDAFVECMSQIVLFS